MVRYTGRAFRKAHNLRQIDVAAGVPLRRATLVRMERNEIDCINRALVGKIVAWFRTRGIPCDVTDLLEYVPDPPPEDAHGTTN